MDWLLGIDGGGTKTTALLATLDGQLVGSGSSGPSNYQVVGVERAVAALRTAAEEAFAAAGLTPQWTKVAVACFGLAGVDRPKDHDRLARRIAVERLARRFVLVNDAELVLAAGCPDGWGVALMSGTGSICLGRSPHGQLARAGGWGYLLGDEGSGFDIAVQALRLATRTADGRDHAPSLLQAALNFWSLQTAEELIDLVYRQLAGTPTSLAAFAPRVLELAQAGDPSAQWVLEQAAEALAAQATAVIRRLQLDHPPLAFGGGILRASPLLRSRVIDSIPVPLGPVTVVDHPAFGALAIARKLAAQAP